MKKIKWIIAGFSAVLNLSTYSMDPMAEIFAERGDHDRNQGFLLQNRTGLDVTTTEKLFMDRNFRGQRVALNEVIAPDQIKVIGLADVPEGVRDEVMHMHISLQAAGHPVSTSLCLVGESYNLEIRGASIVAVQQGPLAIPQPDNE